MAGPNDCPPGVVAKFLPAASSRPLRAMRGILVHTNAASRESSLQAQWNYANSAPDTTKPHYIVDRAGGAWKCLPSNRKGICNYRADEFFLSIETTDLGYPTPGGLIGFTGAQAEKVAQIIAWEAALWGFPIAYPKTWDGTGVGCHTEPFTHPYWTKYAGKTCPGEAKKREMRDVVMPRARQILAPAPPPSPDPAPPPAPPPDSEDFDTMTPAPATAYNSRDDAVNGTFVVGSTVQGKSARSINIAPGFGRAQVIITLLPVKGSGHVRLSNTGRAPDFSAAQFAFGHPPMPLALTVDLNGAGALDVYAYGEPGAECDIIIARTHVGSPA